MDIHFNVVLKNIRNDRKNNSFKSYIILRNYRLGNYFYNKSKSHRFICVFLIFIRIIKEIEYSLLNIDSQIPYEAIIGNNTKLPHSGNGVVISAKAIIGNNVTIFHQVTIGVNEAKDKTNQKIVIGDNCLISAGSKIISCKIGNNCKIGANAVIVKDIPDNSLCYSNSVVRENYYVE